jgi:hypothetical protein
MRPKRGVQRTQIRSPLTKLFLQGNDPAEQLCMRLPHRSDRMRLCQNVLLFWEVSLQARACPISMFQRSRVIHKSVLSASFVLVVLAHYAPSSW